MAQRAAHPFRIVILASGNGTNAEHISRFFGGVDSGSVVYIFTNNPRAGVLQRAERLGIPAAVLPKNVYSDGAAFLAELQAQKADLVVCAGYLKLIPPEVTQFYAGRIVNIHPSLLPQYGGKGMYGMRVHEAVIAAGEAQSGITIHHVNERYDEGQVILQVPLDVEPGMSPAELATAIHELEYAHFPQVILQLLAQMQQDNSLVLNTESEMKKIQCALLSVYHKDGLDRIARKLDALGVKIISTGGTARFVRDLGIEVHEVADLTAYPSILGGRVKTLHPKVFGGILARRGEAGDVATMEEYDIPSIDLVIVDLYPFEDTVAGGGSEQEIIEKIDIGGISLIRAAAKNFNDVLCVASMELYDEFYEMLDGQQGLFSREQRQYFAGEAFDISSHYDSAIYSYMAPQRKSLKVSSRNRHTLRYGENPHQKAWFFGDISKQFKQLHGKALSYNNTIDLDAAIHLMDEFYAGPPCFAIFKHTNPCGVAVAGTMKEAWDRALACDPVSAFGGILICNGEVNLEVAEAIHEIFFEVLVARSFTEDAFALLSKKKKRILGTRDAQALPNGGLRSAMGGILFQERDNLSGDSSVYVVKTTREAVPTELADIVFAEKVGKHLKSNAIAIAKDQQLIGSGIGQTSRVDALKQALQKARDKGFAFEGSVLYSDAFFPFKDCAELAHAAGIEVLAEPGGSIRDQETIDYCEANDMCLVFTKDRHFKH